MLVIYPDVREFIRPIITYPAALIQWLVEQISCETPVKLSALNFLKLLKKLKT